jgi:D-alanine-D-alanine ligase
MESRSNVPANLPSELDQRIQKLAIAAYQAAGCKDWARIDLRMDKAGNLYILEANLGPGIASDCIFARMAFAAGWDMTKLVNTILNHALERYRNAGSERINTYLGSLAAEREHA